MPPLPRFKMPFEPTTIDHLGLRLYSTLPPVISELVSNGYDAEAAKVEVTVPVSTITTASEVIVRDYGHGMSPEELADEYLPIGRKRRGDDENNVWSKNKIRKVTGRKGLGKLSVFGVATEMEVTAIQNGNGVCLRMDYIDIKKWPEQHPGQDYEPTVVNEKTGPTTEPDGVRVVLRKLHRKSPMNADEVRRGLARRLNMIGAGFDVEVNGKAIGPGDRVSRDDCPKRFSWDVAALPDDGKVAQGKIVTGWLGFLESSSQANRGIDIYANNKAVELGSYFEYASTHAQFARAHLVGEIHADFLDHKEDLISTARNSVLWESETGRELKQWGCDALKWLFDEWIELRKKEKEEEVIQAAGFDKWLETRSESERRVAKRLVRLLVDNEKIDTQTAKPLLEVVKSSVETVAFHDLVLMIEQETVDVAMLLKLFGEWRVIEAREHLKLADGRAAAIEQLDRFMKEGALEVQELQPLLDDHPWLLDQTWHQIDRQAHYSKLLRENCVEPKGLDEKDRRLDILGITQSGKLTVVELKRPDKTLSRSDLRQIEDYVIWARQNLMTTGTHSIKSVEGRLIVGKSNPKERDLLERLQAKDIRVETYADLLLRAQEYYGEVDEQLKKVAPEYARSRKKKKGVN